MSEDKDNKDVVKTPASHATRSALIKSGAELFAAHGFDGTTTDQIAKAADVNKAMINYHFGGKAGLYQEILALVFADAGRQLLELKDRDEPADQLLRRFIEIFARTLEHYPTLPFLILREAMSGGRHLGPRAFPLMLDILGVIDGILRRGRQEGTLRPTHPLLAHFSIAGTLVFYFATAPFRERMIAEGKFPGNPPGLEEVVRHTQDLMINGLATRPSAPLVWKRKDGTP
jgi:AcrR family transcriptional regulator